MESTDHGFITIEPRGEELSGAGKKDITSGIGSDEQDGVEEDREQEWKLARQQRMEVKQKMKRRAEELRLIQEEVKQRVRIAIACSGAGEAEASQEQSLAEEWRIADERRQSLAKKQTKLVKAKQLAEEDK